MKSRTFGGKLTGRILTRITGTEVPPEQKRSLTDGETHWSQANAQGLQTPVPQQPSEIDESASSQQAASTSMEAVGKLAHSDTVGPIEDTDIGPVLDAVYNGPITDEHRVGDDENIAGERDPRKSTSSKMP